jgi:hypothetical protein
MSSMYGAGPTGGNRLPRGTQQGQLQQFTPEMMQLFSQLIGGLGPDSFLSKLASGDQSTFEQMERPALRQFAGLQGNLASRFSGMGTGARRSSGFQNTMNAASSDFAQQLQGRRMELQSQALRDLYGYGNMLLGQRPYEQFLTDKQPSFWEQILGVGLPLAGGAVGGFFGGPAGAMAGASIGGAAARGFQ